MRDRLLCVDRGLERADVYHLLTSPAGDTLVGDRHDAEHDERDVENRCILHNHVLWRKVTQPASSARRQSRATE